MMIALDMAIVIMVLVYATHNIAEIFVRSKNVINNVVAMVSVNKVFVNVIRDGMVPIVLKKSLFMVN